MKIQPKVLEVENTYPETQVFSPNPESVETKCREVHFAVDNCTDAVRCAHRLFHSQNAEACASTNDKEVAITRLLW